MSEPLVMRIMALSINTAKRAGSIIRDVMQKGNLGIVEKVSHYIHLPIVISKIKVCRCRVKMTCKLKLIVRHNVVL